MITPPTMRRFADYSEMRPRNWSEKRSTDKSALKNRQYCRGNPNTGSAALPMTTETVCC